MKLKDLRKMLLGCEPDAEVLVEVGGITYSPLNLITRGDSEIVIVSVPGRNTDRHAEVAEAKAKLESEIPEYRFGGPRRKILTYLEQVGMLPTTAELMHECCIGGLHDAGCALDELLQDGLIGKVKNPDGVTEFYLKENQCET